MKKLFFIEAILFLILSFTIIESQTVWTLQNNPLPNGTLLGKVQFVTAAEGWISAANGKLLHTTDSGTNWNIVTPFPNDKVTSAADPSLNMWWINQKQGWKLNWIGTGFNDAQGAVMHKTTDGGITWTKKVITNALGDIGLQVQFVDANNGWISIYNFRSRTGSILSTKDGGDNWTSISNMPATDEVSFFYFADTKNCWITSINDKPPLFQISKSTNGGTDWTVQYTDKTPNADTSSSSGAMQFIDQNNGWVVGPNGRILRTTNGGTAWESFSNAGITNYANSKCLFFLNSSTGWIGTNINSSPALPTQRYILQTNNSGSSWSKQVPPLTGAVFSIYFTDAKNGWFTGDQCIQNCNGPDSLKVYAAVIGHTTNGSTGINFLDDKLPTAFSLEQNYPNPFNPVTRISYSLPKDDYVSIKIFDVLGREVMSLVNEFKNAGNYSVELNGSGLVSGVYLYKMMTNGFSSIKKLLLLK